MNGLGIGQLWASLGLDTSMFNKQIQQVNQQLTATSNTMASTAQKFRSFGWLATTTITAPLMLAAKSVSTAGMEFEFSMKKMIGLAGVASSEIAGLSKVVKELSNSTGVDPQKLADTLYFIESSGLKGKKALDALQMSAKGAASGMGDAKDIANLLTAALNAYETEGLTASRVMDVLTATIREGKAEPEELVRAFGSILPIAQQLGVSIDEVGGALATMTLVTASTANSATYLRNVLFHILKPSNQVVEAFKEMHTSVGEVQSMLRNQGFDATMKYLDKLTADYGKTLADVFPDLRSLLGALNYTGQAAEKTAGIMDRVNNSTGDFGKNYEEMSVTIKNAWNRAMSSLKTTSIDLGAVIGPYLTKLFETLAKWLKTISDAFLSLSPGMQKFILGVLTLTAALGPLSLISSTLIYIYTGLVPILNMLKVSFIALKTAVISFNTILAANPYMAAFAAIMLLASVYLLLGNRTSSLTAAQKAQQSIDKDVTSQYSQQAGEIRKLLFLIENVNIANEERIKAINTLKGIVPEYNGALTEEGILINHNTEAIDNYLVALQKKIRMQVMENKISDAMTKLEEAKLNRQYRYNKMQEGDSNLRKLNPFYIPSEKFWEWSIKQEIKATDELNEYIKIYDDFMKSLNDPKPIKFPLGAGVDASSLLNGNGNNNGNAGAIGDDVVGLINAKKKEIEDKQKQIDEEIDRNKLELHKKQMVRLQEELDLLNKMPDAEPKSIYEWIAQKLKDLKTQLDLTDDAFERTQIINKIKDFEKLKEHMDNPVEPLLKFDNAQHLIGDQLKELDSINAKIANYDEGSIIRYGTLNDLLKERKRILENIKDLQDGIKKKTELGIDPYAGGGGADAIANAMHMKNPLKTDMKMMTQWEEAIQRIQSQRKNSADPIALRMRLMEKTADDVSRAFGNMWNVLITGGDKSKTVLENLADVWKEAIGQVIQDLITAITKALVLRAIFTIFSGGSGGAAGGLGDFVGEVGSNLAYAPNIGKLSTLPTVVPSAASNLQSTLGFNDGGQVRFVIEGDKLVGILDKQGKRNSIF